MATETFSITGAPHSFCTCGDPSCRGDCNSLPVEDVSDLIDAGVWEERLSSATSASRSEVAARKRTVAKTSPAGAEPGVEDAADLFAAGVLDHKLM